MTSPDAAAAIPSVVSSGSSPVIAGEIASLVRSSHWLQHLTTYLSCIKLAELAAGLFVVAVWTSIQNGAAYAATTHSDLGLNAVWQVLFKPPLHQMQQLLLEVLLMAALQLGKGYLRVPLQALC